ncbi:uncharacterized protein [Montipora foliosa]|uniref:uncharacterized protein n=1 Tax=Montipora foliosa TaxID=591990 RepID=UPI0035F1AC7D
MLIEVQSRMETIEHLAAIIFWMCSLWRVASSEPCSFMVIGSSRAINLSSSFVIENTCIWHIEVPPHHNIRLNFTTLNIVNQPGSNISSVKVYDGRNESQTLLGRFTENKSHFSIQSSGRYMFVVATGVASFKAVYTSRARRAKPSVIIPLGMVRTVLEHYVWCSSEGTPPINISLMNSTTTLASGKGIVWSKLNHDGNYSCVATNEVGTESKTFYISLTDFRVCVNLCDCRGTTSRWSQFENIFRCTEKYSAHLLNNIPTTTTKLWLYNNEITHLPENVFSGLGALQHLWLFNNEITHLPENVFSGLGALQHLSEVRDSVIARGTCEASWVTSVAGMVGKARFPVAVAEVEAGTSGSVIGGRESAKASVATEMYQMDWTNQLTLADVNIALHSESFQDYRS